MIIIEHNTQLLAPMVQRVIRKHSKMVIWDAGWNNSVSFKIFVTILIGIPGIRS